MHKHVASKVFLQQQCLSLSSIALYMPIKFTDNCCIFRHTICTDPLLHGIWSVCSPPKLQLVTDLHLQLKLYWFYSKSKIHSEVSFNIHHEHAVLHFQISGVKEG